MRTKVWAANIKQISEKLASYQPTQPMGRADIQQIFGVGRSVASAMMKVIGTDGVDKDLVTYAGGAVVSAGAVLDYVHLCPEGQQYARLQALQSPKVKVEVPPVMVARANRLGLAGLPTGVTIGPGRIEITFCTPLEGKQLLFTLAKAMLADPDGFDEAVEAERKHA